MVFIFDFLEYIHLSVAIIVSNYTPHIFVKNNKKKNSCAIEKKKKIMHSKLATGTTPIASLFE